MKYFLVMLCFLTACANHQQKVKTTLYLTSETAENKKVGTVWFKDTANGLLVEVSLKNLPQGEHGFHIHEFPSCENMLGKDGTTQHALSAGGHYDPKKTGKHLGPNGGGHLGDLPFLTVAQDGTVKRKFYLKNIKVEDFKNRSIMIHEGGDNYKDAPFVLGGGGKRIACGIIN